MNHDGVVLRGYRDGDLDAMFRLDEVCFEAPFRFSRSAMRRFAETRRARVVIAESGGELAGFCIVHVEMVELESVGYVVTLDVASMHRRNGVATRLMEQSEVEAHEAGCSSMALHVFTGNEAAIRFYERMGYAFWTRDMDFYGVGVDALVYRKGMEG